MYGYTPPAVIAVDADLLSDCGGFQGIAAAIERQLRVRPVWAVVGATLALEEADDGDRLAAVEAYYRDPRDAPSAVPDPARAVAEALAHHVAELGAYLPVRDRPTPQGHTPASAVVPGTWYDAAEAAQILGTPTVVAWAAEAALVPAKVRGIAFHFERPDAKVGLV